MSYNNCKHCIFAFFLLFISNFSFAQECGTQAQISSLPNSSCLECNYAGPTILINELMISPSFGDGSLSGSGGGGEGRGEWIELYNPNWCDEVDISCYYLGNSAPADVQIAGTRAGGYVIPEGTIVPPLGFAMVRGQNAAPVPPALLVENGGNVVELVVPFNITDPGICVGPNTSRLWFPNMGGWFAFYDNNGVPQDAVSWGNPSAADLNGVPCVAQLGPCNYSGTLANYNTIPASNKALASSANGSNHTGQSIRRMPDGGTWSGTGAPTYATCNDPNQCLAETGIATCNGQATINVTAGTGPYTYQWNDAANQTNANALNLCAGDYEVVVTDGNACEQTFSVTIIEDIFTLDAVTVDPDCGVNNGSITISVDPPDANYTYVWSANTGVGNNTTTSVTGLGAGTYTVTVSGGGCTNDTTIVLTSPDGITDVALDLVNTNCDQNDGSIQVTDVTGGTAPYTYELVDEATNTSGTFNDLNAGTYELIVTDINDCVYNLTGIVLDNTPGISDATVSVQDEICDQGNGNIIVTNVEDGTPGFTFTLNEETTNNNGNFDNLPGGTYSILIEDAVGCDYLIEGIVIGNIPGISNANADTQATICAEDNGSVSINGIVGGTAPFEYTLNGQTNTSGNFNNVPSGDYEVEIIDVNGCSFTIEDVFIAPSKSINSVWISTTMASCDDNDGSFTIEGVQGGTAPFSYEIPGVSGASSETVYTDLAPGPYVYIVRDQLGCSYEGIVNVPLQDFNNNILIPNVFTPNNDQINDLWFVNAECVKSFECVIINRWGNKIYEYFDIDGAWNGFTLGGNRVTTGVYFYQINMVFTDDTEAEFHGHITVPDMR